MSVVLNLKPETEQKLAARAARAGLTLAAYLEKVADQESRNGASEERTDTSGPSFEKMTAPLAAAIEATGMSEEEVGTFLGEVVKEVRTERRAAKK
jgi:hypothetical protein